MSTLPDSAALARLLDRYAPVDASEQRHRADMLRLSERGPAAFARDEFDPGHFTASAFVRCPRGERLLLVHHAKLGLWLQPGGHVEAGDGDLVATASREVEEETGVSALSPALEGAIFDLDVHPIPARPGEPSHRHFDVRFLFDAADTMLSPGDEVLGARWLELDDIAACGADESVMRAVRKLRGVKR